mgnify:CR=1
MYYIFSMMTKRYTKLLSIRLQPSEYDYVIEEAKNAGISAGKMIRNLIMERTNNGPKADP